MTGAIISTCGKYRYRLDRGDSGPLLAWIMVNPSTADAETDDATIRKVRGFTERAGFGRFVVGNKFAYRATDIKALRSAAFPVGPENDDHLKRIVSEASGVVLAWGPLGKLPPSLRRRWYAVHQIVTETGHRPVCLGVASDGHPLHPLMQPYAAALVEWGRPA